MDKRHRLSYVDVTEIFRCNAGLVISEVDTQRKDLSTKVQIAGKRKLCSLRSVEGVYRPFLKL